MCQGHGFSLHILTTSVMLRIFRVMASLSWFGVGVNHSFWNVSFTNFCKRHWRIVCVWKQIKQKIPRLDSPKWTYESQTLMPSSSLTLLIILTHISVTLLKVGCSRQMSRRILITLFLTLMPVSWRKDTNSLLEPSPLTSATAKFVYVFKWRYKPESARSACHNTVRLAAVDSVRTDPTALLQLLLHWWSYPSVARELLAACPAAHRQQF